MSQNSPQKPSETFRSNNAAAIEPELAKTSFSSPLGKVTVLANQDHVVEVSITETGRGTYPRLRATGHRILDRAASQIAEYFAAKRSVFDVPLCPEPDTFDGRVRIALREVALGQTVTYRELALAAGNAKAVRAAGNAVRRNRLLLLVPSHRVLSSSGELTGFDGGAGIATKRLLLTAEGAWFKDPAKKG